MDTFIVTARVQFEIEATDQADAIALAEGAIKRARFEIGYKLVSVRNHSEDSRKEIPHCDRNDG
jgi:hypothetical protein